MQRLEPSDAPGASEPRGGLVSALSHAARSRFLYRFVSVVVLVLCLGFLAWKVYSSWEALKAYDWRIRYPYLIPSFVLYLCVMAVVIWGWRSVMDSLARPIPLRDHVKIYGFTNLMRRIPAGVLWVTAGRAYAYKDQKVSGRASAISSFLELVIVIVTGLPLAAWAATLLGFIPSKMGVGLAVAGLALVLCTIHPTVLARLFRLARHETIQPEITYRDTLGWALIYTVMWLLAGAELFVICRLFVDLPVSSLPATIGAWVASSLISYVTLLSPSGFGVKELTLTFFLGRFMHDPLPLLIAIATRVIWTVYDIIAGVVAWAL